MNLYILIYTFVFALYPFISQAAKSNHSHPASLSMDRKGIIFDKGTSLQSEYTLLYLDKSHLSQLTQRFNVEIEELRPSTKRIFGIQHSTKLDSCEIGVDLPVGKMSSNISHGAYCVISADGINRSVFICDDDMFGHFNMIDASKDNDLNEILSLFVAKYCFGG